MRLLRGDEPAADDLLASDGERARLGNVAKLLKERKAFRKELFAAAKANEKLKLPTVSLQQNKFNELFKNGLTPKQAFELGKFKTRVEAKKYEKYYELAKAKLAAKERMARMVQIREARAERMRQAGTKAIIRDN
ncbi:uncharacterized protein IUM83_17223 [Phytophthora cinnamomi]|uniref:uncharacterized protein n=1 Tax=Phytophthora cinnamomi TaxID=4785 RepID=UPI00355A3A13|nr:hypothetical protein IUM83_17223 [Phytophthora cinnamomi]